LAPGPAVRGGEAAGRAAATTWWDRGGGRGRGDSCRDVQARERFVLLWFGLVWFGLVWFGLCCFVPFASRGAKELRGRGGGGGTTTRCGDSDSALPSPHGCPSAPGPSRAVSLRVRLSRGQPSPATAIGHAAERSTRPAPKGGGGRRSATGRCAVAVDIGWRWASSPQRWRVPPLRQMPGIIGVAFPQEVCLVCLPWDPSSMGHRGRPAIVSSAQVG
jgi:hypothetical protein